MCGPWSSSHCGPGEVGPQRFRTCEAEESSPADGKGFNAFLLHAMPRFNELPHHALSCEICIFVCDIFVSICFSTPFLSSPLAGVWYPRPHGSSVSSSQTYPSVTPTHWALLAPTPTKSLQMCEDGSQHEDARAVPGNNPQIFHMHPQLIPTMKATLKWRRLGLCTHPSAPNLTDDNFSLRD